MRKRRRGGEPEAWQAREDDLVIDLRERLAPYEVDDIANPGWRQSLIAADERRRDRPLRARPIQR